MPNRGAYPSLVEVEARLSRDDAALTALCAGCRVNHPGAWSLLLLALGRRLRRYLSEKPPEDLDTLFGWVVEAVRKGRHPVLYLRGAVKDARKSREASEARAEEHAYALAVHSDQTLAYDGEEQTLAAWDEGADPFLRRRLIAALDDLTKQQRAVLLLDADGYTSPEIAELLKVSEGGVRVRLAEARKILRNTLADVSPLPKRTP